MNIDSWGPTEDFFIGSESEQLHKIYLWARARFAAPWAVFGATLLRVAASTGPEVQLPGIIGGPASLNMLAAFVSPSGGGKGISDKVSRLAWPTPIVERPIGSGEGIAALFAPPKKEGAERVTRAIINVTEIDTLAGIASRQGSILLAQLKAMAMGELLGQSNASDATTRVVQPHTYRCCLSVGAQPGHTSVIFNDATGGTPQRFLWFSTIDPDMPPDYVKDPGPLDTALPGWARLSTGTVEIKYGPSEITTAIIGAHLARQRGDADALDGHAMLTRCKVAATLAILHHRSVVSELDWQLSGEVMAVSDRTRDWIVSEARRAARAKVRARALDRAAGEEFYDASRLATVRRSIIRMLDRDGEQAGGDLRRRLGKREKRELYDQAISLLEAEGLVLARPGEHSSVRYRLGSPVTNEVTPQRTSSEGVTTGVTRDHPATVTDIDSRRSRDDVPPKLTAREWFANHIAEMQAAGHATATSFAVLKAGEAAGFTRNNLSQAAQAHPDVKTIDRKGGFATWSIEPGKDIGDYLSAPQWLDRWLDEQTTDTVSPDDAKAAGEAAGHPWHSVRRAAGISPRIESLPAHGDSKTDRVWHIRRPTSQTGSEENSA